MKLTTLVAATLLSMAPMLASAACFGHEKQAMSCAEGTVYDADSNSCKVVTG